MAQSFTFALVYARSTLICSMARAERKHDAPQTKGIMPPLANPAPTPTMFCSAIPTFTKRSGNFSLKFLSFADDSESLATAHTRSSAAAISSNALT